MDAWKDLVDSKLCEEEAGFLEDICATHPIGAAVNDPMVKYWLFAGNVEALHALLVRHPRVFLMTDYHSPTKHIEWVISQIVVAPETIRNWRGDKEVISYFRNSVEDYSERTINLRPYCFVWHFADSYFITLNDSDGGRCPRLLIDRVPPAILKDDPSKSHIPKRPRGDTWPYPY